MTYHCSCFRVGPPFTTRRQKDGGLSFPSSVSVWPTFICEACTVRTVLGRELSLATDVRLVCLERMRLLDLFHGWASSTHSLYQSKLRQIRQFEQRHSLIILPRDGPAVPPATPDIPLAWCQEALLIPVDPSSSSTVSYNTARQLRSAASQYLALHSLLCNPSSYFDSQRRLLLQPARSTDAASMTLLQHGLAARIGTATHPSTALLFRHVQALLQSLESQLSTTEIYHTRLDLLRAIVATHLLWLGWLRSSELFGLCWRDITIVFPPDGPSIDLPVGLGAVLLRLLPETKSSRSQTADVVISYSTRSGLHPGRWLHRLRRSLGSPPPHQQLFLHQDGSSWTSRSFRTTFLYPSLRSLQTAGDPALTPYTGPDGNRLEDKFWALHSFRRGARSHVSRRRLNASGRPAPASLVYEHGRWRRRRSSEPIDVQYLEWPVRDKIILTLVFM